MTPSQILDAKRRLESSLAEDLERYRRTLVRAFVRQYAAGDGILNANDDNESLSKTLLTHYRRVGDEFDDEIADQLPADVAITSDERSELAALLAAWYVIRADDQSKIISDTTNTNITQSLVVAMESAPTLDNRTVAVTAGANLNRLIASRIGGIAATETQASAEFGREQEAQVLTNGLGPSKQWFTMGDDRVRFDHVGADGQIVPANETFLVGGERLNHPGDMSNGATIGNVAGCRCTVAYDVNGIIDNRRELLVIRIERQLDGTLP